MRDVPEQTEGHAEHDAVRARIVLAARSRCAEIGLRRLTMDDVARRAGLGRATLYRRFRSKDELVEAVILAETQAFFAALDAALDDCAGDAERLAEGFAFALGYLRSHVLLNTLLRTEPETLLPYLIGGGELIRVATDAVCTRMRRGPGQSRDLSETAELLVRLVLSLALTPESGLDVGNRRGAVLLVRQHLLPRQYA